jgi:hypothetical protein
VSEIVVFGKDDGWSTWRKLLRDPEVEVVEAGEREKFSFHLGGFHTRMAYRRHPRRPDHLIPYREFDEVILLEKFNEAIRVMTTLGASDVKCTSFRSVDRAHKGILGWKQNGEQVEANAEVEKKVASGYDYEQHGAGSAPRDPSPLVWPDEPGITSAVDSVLNNRAHSVRISVNREQTQSRKLEAKLKSLGIALGGSSGKEQADRLLFEATFPALDG